MYILVDISLLWFLFFFQTSKLHFFIKLHRNCQLLISLEQSKTPSMLINFGECDCQHIKIRNVKSLSSMYSVGKCINSSRFNYHHKESFESAHFESFNGYCVPVYLCIQCSVFFFMKWIIILCGLSSEVNILGYATSTSYTAINMTAEGVYRMQCLQCTYPNVHD